MSKSLSAMLGQPEHLVAKTVGKLEDKNGYPSHDVRHLAQNIQRTRSKLTELGLDADDTTAEELYHALLAKFEADSRQFDIVNAIDRTDFNQKAARATELINQNLELPQRWALKATAAKNLLRGHPPKRLMKQLGYRSLDSMLKRENLCEVYLAAGLSESESWLKDQQKLINKLDSTVFELRKVKLGYLNNIKWARASSGQPVIYNDTIGYIALADNSSAPQMPLLSMAVLLVDVLAGLEPLNISEQVAKLNPMLAWWSDMDGLVSSLNYEHVSMNIKDVGVNSLHAHSFSEQVLDSGRQSFWQQLLARYDNQLEIQEDAVAGLKDQLVSLKAPFNQPAFEYVEDV